jgi:DUF1365 family protein
MPMDQVYEWWFNAPGERLAVHTALRAESGAGSKVFDATLVLERVPITRWSLAGALASFPFMTLQVIAAIYWEALRLSIKRIPFHPHPGRAGSRLASAGDSSSARAVEPR